MKKSDDDLPKKSLGKGQEKAADTAIKRARLEGKWIILQNCHMCPSFLPILESRIVETGVNYKKIYEKSSKKEKGDKNEKEEEDQQQNEEEIDEESKIDPQFRFWITTMPDENFPT